MKILVIIVSYKDKGNLQECIRSLDSGRSLPRTAMRGRNDNDVFDIYVHDNSDKNLGFAGGVNEALKKRLVDDKTSGYDWVWLSNPDCMVEFKGIYGSDKGIVKRNSKQLFVNDIEYDIFSPVIYDARGKIWFAGGKINKWSGECTNKSEKRNNGKVDWVSGCSMFIKRKVFEKIGLFDERFFLFYEDVDFCLRARAAGFRIGVVGKEGMRAEGIEGTEGLDGIKVVHKVSQSVNKLTNKYAIEMKSKFYLLKKHWRYFCPTAILISWLRMIKHGIKQR